MRVPVCHHYWQNGQNATWAPPVFPVPEIEAQVKNDYLFLQKARPISRQYGAYTVFFDYRPGIDAFGRKIVPISFAFCKTDPDLAKIAPAIRKALANAAPDQFFIDLPDGRAPQNTPDKAPKREKPKILWFAMGLLLALALAWKFGCAKDSASRQDASISDTVKLNNSKTVSQNTKQDPVRQEVGIPPVQTSQAVEQSASQPDICAREDLWQAFLNCPRAFVRQRCQGKTGLNFQEFRKSDPACRPAYGKLEAWSEKLPIFKAGAQIEKKDAEALRKFIFRP